MKIRLGDLRRLIQEAAKSRGRLVIVDVQPEYEDKINFDVADMLRMASGYSRILVLWNGPELGMSSEQELKGYYFEKLDYDEEALENFLSRADFFDKGYGFFRDVMDHPCFSPQSVVKIVKYMIDKDITNISELSSEDVESIGVKELLVDELENYGFYIPDLKNVLSGWNGSDMVGGQEDECMAEVEILSKALGINLNKIRNFIY